MIQSGNLSSWRKSSAPQYFRLEYRILILTLAIVGCQIPLLADAYQNQSPAVSEPPKPPGLSQEEIMDGWLSLFDGQTLYGWKAESDANWKVVDGEIRADSGQMGLLRTTSQFDDFEIRLEFRSTPTTNSGLFLRTSPVPQDPGKDCFELNIAQPDQNPFPTGSLVYREKATVNLDPEKWNRYRAVLKGSRMQVFVNDQLTIDYTNPKPLGRGFVGLQFRKGAIAFRNIILKPLEQESLFDGKGLAGWKLDQKMDSRFTVTKSGELNMTGGKGQIESRKSYGDFVFTTQIKTNAVGLNSGVFFRCIPGDLMNGYESQIQNQFKNGDRTQPEDCGTGGIFRRKPARAIVADDQVWFTKTIVAVGPHIAVWVNGYQVCDWTDQRKPDANPRRGLRLEKGTLIIQGHDPTTDVSFRNIKAREMVRRWPSR